MTEATRRRRRRGSPPTPTELASPLEDEDLLQEILLRLPPQPSSLPRASAVCKLWRRLVTDPKFLRRFRDRHREPPILGFFETRDSRIHFRSILNPPDRIPPNCFDLSAHREDDVLDCHHGRVLLLNRRRRVVFVCDPVAGEKLRLTIPAELMIPGDYGYIGPGYIIINGVVLCAAGDQAHVHGSCHSSPFKVVLVSMYTSGNRPLACVYSSETGIWGDPISMEAPCRLFCTGSPGTLVGNALYWNCQIGRRILEFDLDRQSLAVIEEPPGLSGLQRRQIVKADDGDVGLAVLSEPSFQIWQRKVNSEGVTTWLLQKTADMHCILGISDQIKRNRGRLLGYDDDTDMMFLYMHDAVHMVHLKSMQHKKKLYEADPIAYYHPFKSFFAPG